MVSLPVVICALGLSLQVYPLPYDYDLLFPPPAAGSAAKEPAQDPVKEFKRGVAAHKDQRWQDSAEAFAHAADGFPLLADYASFFQGEALFKLGRFEEAVSKLTVARDAKSAISRRAFFLLGQSHYANGNFQEAFKQFRAFTDNYSSGSDSITARFMAIQCLETLGEKNRAAAEYRAFRLSFPASPEARSAEDRCRALSTVGIAVQPYTPDELMARGELLIKQRQYALAVATLKEIPSEKISPQLQNRIILRISEALVEGRRHKEAYQELTSLPEANLPPDVRDERKLLLARTMQRLGREEEAVNLYVQVAESEKKPLAQKALFLAAQLKKGQGKLLESLAFLDRVINTDGDEQLKAKALWEAGWSRYLQQDFTGAAATFSKLASIDVYRDSALYWLARSLENGNKVEDAQNAWKTLVQEFPFGFYALRYKQERGIDNVAPTLSTFNVTELLPPSEGFNKAKALAAAGLIEEAKKEISTGRSASTLELARLYLELGDYRTPMTFFPRERLRKIETSSIVAWGINYPCGFRENVLKYAAERGVTESLVFSIIRQESSYSPNAVSSAGAVGLMQLMPATAKALARHEEINREKLCEPDLNIRLGVHHLANLLTSYNRNEVLAIAAYNAGSGNVARWQKAFGNLREDEFIENIPFQETREYVKKVIAGKFIYETLYAIPLPDQKAADRTPSEDLQSPAS